MNTVVTKNTLTSKEKEELLKEILGKKYNTNGENLRLLSSIIDKIDKLDNALSFAELVPYLTAFFNNRFITIVSSGVTIISIVMFPIDSMIKILDAYQTGHKMYSYRAIAYSVTAWAFDKPQPNPSQRILRNLRAPGGPTRDKSIVKEYETLWKKTSHTVFRKLNMESETKLPKNIVKIIFRAMADDNEQKLCLLILKGFENKCSYIGKLTWKSNYSIKYPR